jgi:RNA polymerase sigma-70 factor (ECF subfamily)
MSDDRDLLEAWRTGDKAAGDVLFERHYPRLYGFLNATIPDAADDLVQRTMLACIEGRNRIETDFVAYMFGTARQLVYREYDRRQRDGKRIDFGVTSVHALAPSPSSIFARHELVQMLEAAKRMIPLDYQVALDLYYGQSLRGPRIASALEIPEGTVRGRLRRGLEGLRKVLAEFEANPELLAEALRTVDQWASELPDGRDDD